MRGIANMLRVLLFEPDAAGRTADSVGVIAFEIDDQTGEELAVGLDRLRGLDGVLDVTQWAVHGKKGRMAVQVQVLCRPDALDAVIERCFLETTTIGLRHRVERRVLLPREAGTAAGLAVKRVIRPGGVVTAKPEMDALGAAADNQPERARLRRRAEEDGDG
jgi:pyridinium-3,5-bisthiocarboxylic acid mononucleotide nickel chelatase